MHKKNQGTLGEHVVITELIKHDISVFKDVGDNARFDLVIYVNKQLVKIQVKCVTRNKYGSSNLYLYKHGPNYRYTYELGDVDWFAVVDMETLAVAWLKHIDFVGMGVVALRHTPPLNNNEGNRYFSDYSIDKMIGSIV